MIPKPINPTELRKNLYAVVREVASGESRYLVTPTEGDAVVILSRDDYNALLAEQQILRDLREAEADIAARRTQSPAAVRRFVTGRSKKSR
jgi:prevent-host-death family protein